MSNRWTSPSVEPGRSAIEAKTVDEGAPAPPAADGVDPVLGHDRAETLKQFMLEQMPLIHNLCRRVADDAAVGDDLFQEVWLALEKAAPRYRGDAEPLTYLYAIARRKFKDWRKRVSRTRKLPLDSQIGDRLAAPSPTSTMSHLRVKYRRLVLSVDDKIVLDLYAQGRSIAEIATVLNASEAATRKRYQRALDRARKLAAAMPPSSR